MTNLVSPNLQNIWSQPMAASPWDALPLNLFHRKTHTNRIQSLHNFPRRKARQRPASVLRACGQPPQKKDTPLRLATDVCFIEPRSDRQKPPPHPHPRQCRHEEARGRSADAMVTVGSLQGRGGGRDRKRGSSSTMRDVEGELGSTRCPSVRSRAAPPSPSPGCTPGFSPSPKALRK